MSELTMLKPYVPSDVIIKLKMSDGSIITPYGYALGEQLWLEGGNIFLNVQTSSGFLSELVSKMLALRTDNVEVILESPDENMRTIFKLFDGLEGSVSLSRCGFRSTDGIPTTTIKVRLH